MTARHKGKWRLLTLLAVGVLATATLFAAACGDDDDENGDTTPTGATATAPAGEPTEPTGEETPEATEPAGNDDETTLNVAEDAVLGEILTDANGFTLYTFGNDQAGSGRSTCVDGCAQAWPPLTVTGEPTAGDGIDGELETIERVDGTTQVTYNGQPLYLYAADAEPGDTNGHEVGNIWFVATP